MQTLKVIRQFNGTYNHITILKDSNDKVKAIINGFKNQPKKNSKTIVVGSVEYGLDWSIESTKTNKKQKKMESTLQQIIDNYKNNHNEPLDGDEVDDLCERIKADINLNEGNLTNREYLTIISKIPNAR